MKQLDPAAPAPKVSVVVPTFRRAGLLKETIDAILAQTFTDFELIVVDNMSEDGTAAYVTGIDDPRVRYFRNPNGGVIAVNRNFGIRQARGDYVALCDDDDLWLPEKLESQVRSLDGDPLVALCYTNAASFSSSGILSERMVHKRVFKNHYRHLLAGNFIINSTILVRRNVFEQIGYLDESPDRVAVEDYKMWLAVSRGHKLAYVDESLVLYRLHSLANSANHGRMAAKSLRVVLSEHRNNRYSPFYYYAVLRAFVRALYKYSRLHVVRSTP